MRFRDRSVTVIIQAFQAWDPGSTPGGRSFAPLTYCFLRALAAPTRAPYLRARRPAGAGSALGLDGVRRRLPETSASMVSDLRRRLVAGEFCRIASTPATASSPLSFLRCRLVGVSTRSSHCQDPAGSTAPWIVRNRLTVLLTLTRRAHKACSHGALIHSVRTTQRLASPPRPHLLFS